MYNFLFLFITAFCFGQSYNCLEDGVGEIISNKASSKPLKFKLKKYNNKETYLIGNNIIVSSSNKFSFIELINENKKMPFFQNTKEKNNINFRLEDLYYLKYKNEILYIFEFKTFHQGIDRITFNVIFSYNKKKILFKKWNSSGHGISNAFGISNNKLFLLNQIRDSINYYQLNNTGFKDGNKSCLIKNDSIGRICVKSDYKF